VGFVRGIEYGLLYAIEQITGCKTQPCFVTPSDFQVQVEHRDRMLEESRDTSVKEVTFVIDESPAKMAFSLFARCVKLASKEAIIVRCKEYLWARAKGGIQEEDIIFKAG